MKLTVHLERSAPRRGAILPEVAICDDPPSLKFPATPAVVADAGALGGGPFHGHPVAGADIRRRP